MKTVSDLFEINKGHQLALNSLTPVASPLEGVAYVSRSHRNNGVAAWVREIPDITPAEAGNLSVCLRSRNHSLATFVQTRPFYTTYHVAYLTPKSSMALQEKLWWGLCIRANRFRFNFGRQANRTLSSLELPDEVPQWALDVDLPEHSPPDGAKTAAELNPQAWASFPLPDLFKLHPGNYPARRDLPEGTTPLVTASTWNNGVSHFIDAAPDWSGGQLTLASNGSIGSAFFQPRPFSASRDVTVLEPKLPLTPAAALFICAILRKEGARYNYARKWTVGRLRTSVIRLPHKDGLPDLGTMEALVRQVPLGWSVAATEPG